MGMGWGRKEERGWESVPGIIRKLGAGRGGLYERVAGLVGICQGQHLREVEHQGVPSAPLWSGDSYGNRWKPCDMVPAEVWDGLGRTMVGTD